MKYLLFAILVGMGLGCGSDSLPEPPPMDEERKQAIQAHDDAIEAAESQQGK
ncbi:hypothetical protein [Thalassoroseus pseudoceratinae]|uniref:hypothetical protein n=1 Tax=Thalassoroseus pseudoceratinae TaxID=2713176 RepID=UPI00141EC64D|nr:hypothetical protein [Thalassoroseus pseudoceratinae]